MKRIAYAVTGLLALALFATGTTPVHAWTTPSTACSDGMGTEVEIVDDPAVPLYVAVDLGSTYAPTVCYRDRTGLTNAAGFVHVDVSPDQSRVLLWCAGELPATVAVNCFSYADVDPTDPDPSSQGSGVSGWVKVEGVTGTVPLTGAEVGGISTGTDNGTRASDAGTCAWVLGKQLLDSCDGELVGARVVYQAVPVVTTTGTPACAGVFVGGSCIGVWVTVPTGANAYFVGDGGPTASVTVADTTVATPDNHEPGCLGWEDGTHPECNE